MTVKLAGAFLLLLYSNIALAQQPPQTESPPAGQTPQQEQRGTESFPLAVKIIPSPKSEEEAAADRSERDAKNFTDTWLVIRRAILTP